MKLIKYCLIILSFSVVKMLYAVDMESIPHVNEKASNSFKYDYLYANTHRAFAIAPGGAWSWVAGKATENEAKHEALKACGAHTQQKCVLFAINKQVIFNYRDWYTLWGPYKTKQQAKALTSGVLVGQKFPDLVYTNPAGKKTSIHALKGKVRFVHFWGSWCPSCGNEFPAIMDLYRILNDVLPEQVEFVIVQVRESIEVSKLWQSRNSMDRLPLSDSGIQDEEDSILYLRNGETINDRHLARIFPATYVLDKNGVVVFSNMGSVENWTEYVSFFNNAVDYSGK